MTDFTCEILELDAAATEKNLDDLCCILMDSVAGGAAIGFMAPVSKADAKRFWSEDVKAAVESGEQAPVRRLRGRQLGRYRATRRPHAAQSTASRRDFKDGGSPEWSASRSGKGTDECGTWCRQTGRKDARHARYPNGRRVGGALSECWLRKGRRDPGLRLRSGWQGTSCDDLHVSPSLIRAWGAHDLGDLGVSGASSAIYPEYPDGSRPF